MSLNVNEILEAPVLYFDLIDSTNNHAVRLIDADKAQPGLTISALEQEAGKGQRGNSWKAEPGKSLLMSIVLRPPVSADAQFSFNAAVAVAVADTLAALNAKMDIKIKWPNDIIINAKKAGGILIENTFRGSAWSHAVVGLGLNVLQDHFPGALPNATSIRIASGVEFPVRDLLHHIRGRIIRDTAGDLSDSINRFNKWLFRKGCLQTFADASGNWEAVVLGMNQDGQLIVRDSAGQSRACTHGLVQWVWPEAGYPATQAS